MNDDDRKLIAACRAGRTDEFSQLVHRYQDRLYHSVLRMMGHAEDAADIVQESFINAFQSLDSFKGDSEFFTWLYRIAFNATISARRKKRVTISLDAQRNGVPVIDPKDQSVGSVPGEELERTEDEIQLQGALDRLSLEHRSVLVLKDLEGMKYEEIAEVLNVPIGTVRSRLHRARLELKELLDPS